MKMKIKCPKCGSKDTYLFDPTFDGSLELNYVEVKAFFCCEECEHEEKLYVSGNVDWLKEDLGEWVDPS